MTRFDVGDWVLNRRTNEHGKVIRAYQTGMYDVSVPADQQTLTGTLGAVLAEWPDREVTLPKNPVLQK